jgi:hypothetical protein
VYLNNFKILKEA